MIGVFDSGSGGLTVLQAFMDRLPRQPFLYLGDHGNGPYGELCEEDVYALTLSGVETLFRAGCRLVVLACNTAAAVALRRLQQSWLPTAYPDCRVLGVFVPIVEAVTGVDWARRAPSGPAALPNEVVGVFATPRTVASGAFPTEINLRHARLTVVQQACAGLAEGIERDLPLGTLEAIVSRCADQLLSQMGGADQVRFILGCTHYPLVHNAFVKALPKGSEILEQPAIAAESLVRYLAVHPEFHQQTSDDSFPGFYTTGNVLQANAHAQLFFGQEVTFCRF